MSEAWAVDASPLILFARIGRLELLEGLATTLLIPDAVGAGMFLEDEFVNRVLEGVGE